MVAASGGRDAQVSEWRRRGRPASAASPGPVGGRPRFGRLVRLGVGCVAAAVGLVCLLRPPGFVKLFELRLLDWHSLLRGPIPPPPDITLVAIDEASLARLGHWPWPRTRTAEMVVKLTEGGARVIALDLLLNEPDRNSSLTLARDLAERYRRLGLPRAGGPGAEFGRALEEALATSDTDRQLAGALAASGRVVIPFYFAFPPDRVPPMDDEGRRLLNRSRLIGFATPEAQRSIEPRQAAGVLLPIPLFHAAVAASGHANVYPDDDGGLRRMELFIRYGDGYFPSFMLETARLAFGLPRSRLRLTAEQRVELGPRSIPTDEYGLTLLTYYGKAGSFHKISAADVLLNAAPPPVPGHVVIVGFTAFGLMDTRPTPFDPVMPGYEIQATALANILEGRGLRRLVSLVPLEAVAVLLLAACSPLFLPRVGALGGTVAVLAIGVGVFGASHAAFRGGTWLWLIPPLAALAVGHVGSVTYQVLIEERGRRWIKRAFEQYVPAEVVNTVAQNPEALAFGGERRMMTVLFSDIRGYTTFSEAHAPEEVVAILHEYLTAMVQVVFRHGGTLDKFIGDAIMALFGAPLADPDHALNACRAAIDMAEALERLNERWRAAGHDTLAAGIGVSSGEMVVGNLGSEQRFTYTVTGDAVNLGARLEGLTKNYETKRNIIISEDTYALVKDRVTVRDLGSVTVKGKVQAVEIYDLIEVAPPDREERA